MVRRATPAAPTVQAVLELRAHTPSRLLVVPETWRVHGRSRRSVLKIRPVSATNQPVSAETIEIELMLWVVPLVTAVHAVPPLTVLPHGSVGACDEALPVC